MMLLVGAASIRERSLLIAIVAKSRLEAAPTKMKGPDCLDIDVKIQMSVHRSVSRGTPSLIDYLSE